MSFNVLTIGGSRNIGYLSSLRLLESGSTVTFLLRSPSTFDADEQIQKYVRSGKAHLVKGDALVKADVQRSWDEAQKRGHVNLLLFTVGGVPSFHLTKGFVINPPNLVTQCLLNSLSTMPVIPPKQTQPRVIIISSIGLSKTSHAKLPLPLKPLYGHFLDVPHKDKLGAERIASHCAGWFWDAQTDGEPGEEIMGGSASQWQNIEGLPSRGTLKRVLVIRPAFLTDGECEGDKAKAGEKPYRVMLSEEESKCWTISRQDVAHFIVDATLNKWDEFENKCTSIAY